MILQSPGVCELRIRTLEPLARLDGILSGTDKRHDSLGVETARVADGLQEYSV